MVGFEGDNYSRGSSMSESKPADVYRERARAEERLAEKTNLPNVRSLHAAAAARWIEMAERAERHGSRSLQERGDR